MEENIYVIGRYKELIKYRMAHVSTFPFALRSLANDVNLHCPGGAVEHREAPADSRGRGRRRRGRSAARRGR